MARGFQFAHKYDWQNNKFCNLIHNAGRSCMDCVDRDGNGCTWLGLNEFSCSLLSLKSDLLTQITSMLTCTETIVGYNIAGDLMKWLIISFVKT